MSRKVKQELLGKLQWRYSQRGRQGRSRMIDELCEDFGYERKYAIKLLKGFIAPASGDLKPGPRSEYLEVEPIVREIWKNSEMPCGKRLKPALKLWLPHYERHYGKLRTRQRQLVLSASAATLDRLLEPARAAHAPKGRGGTKPGSLLRSQIPVRTDNWDIESAGYLEADTVAHCGSSLAGDFIWSAVFTDICSGWTEGRAVWNKGAEGIVRAAQDVEKSLPFDVLGFDCDNGSEFLNHHLWTYWSGRKKPVKFTRSRPYHKNDNAKVEQKNWMWPRQLLGYERLEDQRLVEPINQLYKQTWGPLCNFFLPSVKLLEKWREGSRWKKRYEPAQTAYQRIKRESQITKRLKAELKERYESMDPFELKEEVEQRLKRILG